MDLAVVVVTFNSAACIDSCLESVREHLPSAEVVVVDNASRDLTPQILRQTNVRLVQNEKNEGFGRASNRGAQAATRGHLLFLNPDVVVTRCDRTRLADLLASQPLGLVGPSSTDSTGLMGLQSERGLLREWLEQTAGTLRPHEWRRRRAAPKPPPEDAWISGSMLLVRRSEFLRVGAFDRRYFLYYEDRDLAARCRRAELPIQTTDVLAGRHTEGGSAGNDDLRAVPAAWAFLGWIEYIYLHRGERRARLAARTGVAALQTLKLLLAGVAKLAPQPRIDRKREQLSVVLELLDEQAAQPPAEDAFCPDARRLLAEAR